MSMQNIRSNMISFYLWLVDRCKASNSKKNIEKSVKNKGKVLSAEQKKSINKLYSSYTKIDTLFHEFYTEKTGIFCDNYIPDDIYYSVIDSYYNDYFFAKVNDNKCYYDILFPQVKQPEIIAKRVNGYWYVGGHHISYNDVAIYLKEELEKIDFFIKVATESQGGKGVYFVPKKDEYKAVEKVVSSIKGDIVIQKSLEQSPELAKLNPSSVNTIRLISLLTKDGNVKIYSSVIRMGIDGAKVDNASSGGITCGIMDDGRLKDIAYSAKGVKYYEHPTSKIKFNSIVVPSFEGIKELVKQLHPLVPYSRLVSWDIAIDKNNDPVLIEANLRIGELDFHQLNNGPLFGSDTKMILDEVYMKK